MSDVFVSYKSDDRARLAPLIAALKDGGFSVWWDQHIAAGADWREEIERHLDAAACVIVVWSRGTDGPSGRFVRDEASRAQESGRYLPITIDDVRPPLGFGEIQAIPLIGWKGDRGDPRYLALVDAVSAQLGAAPSANAQVASAGPRVDRRGMLTGAGALGGLAALGGGAYWLSGGKSPVGKIAVMPFQNLSGDKGQDYFAAGLSEELRGALSRAGLSVIGRESTESAGSDTVSDIARRLGVSHILSGNVRRGADRVRVAARLIDGEQGVDIWAQDYERANNDAVIIQTDVAEQVASALELTVGPALRDAVALGGTENAKALDYYLQGRDLLKVRGNSIESTRAAGALFDRALAEDPEFVLALVARAIWGNFATSYDPDAAVRAAATRSREQDFLKALAIAPGLAVAQAFYATFLGERLRFREALEHISEGVVADSTDRAVVDLYAQMHYAFGSEREAMQAIDKLFALDPLSASPHYRKAWTYLSFGRYQAALEPAERAFAMRPENASYASVMLTALMFNDRLDEAMALVDKVQDEIQWEVACLLGRTGRLAEATERLRAFEMEYGDAAAYQYAQIEAQCGRVDKSLAWLELAVTLEDPGLFGVMRDPMLEPLRQQPRFRLLLERLDHPTIDEGIVSA